MSNYVKTFRRNRVQSQNKAPGNFKAIEINQLYLYNKKFFLLVYHKGLVYVFCV